MSNYQTVNLPRELAESIAKLCMFTMLPQDAQQLRAILAKPTGEPAAWFDPVHNDFLTAAGRATTISMGDGDRLARYTVPLYSAPTAAEELDSVRHWRGKHAEAIRERDQLQADLTARDERIDTLVDDLDQAQYDKDAWKNHEESLWVQVFHGEGDDPFISAVSGAICIEELTLIQQEVVTGAEDMLENGPGFYVLRCRHHEALYDNVGMTEPAHWELDFESYERFPWADEAEAMVREAKETEVLSIDDIFEVPDCCFCCDTGHIIIDDTQPEYITTPCTECEKGKEIEATAISPGAQVAALMESRGEP